MSELNRRTAAWIVACIITLILYLLTTRAQAGDFSAPATALSTEATRAVLEYGGVFPEREFSAWKSRLYNTKRDRDEAVTELAALLAEYNELERKLNHWHVRPEHDLRLRMLPSLEVEDTAERGMLLGTDNYAENPAQNPSSDPHRYVRQLDALRLVQDALQCLAPEPERFAAVIEHLAHAEDTLSQNSGTAKWVTPTGAHVSRLLARLDDKTPHHPSRPEPPMPTSMALTIMTVVGCVAGLAIGRTLRKSQP